MQKIANNTKALKCIFSTLFSTLIITILLQINCSHSNVAGGSEIGNPSFVVGYVYNDSGVPVLNCTVYILPQDYKPIESEIREVYRSGYKTTTDSNGYYILDSITKGTYTLSAFSAEKKFLIYHSKVDIIDDTINFGNDTTASPSTIMVYFPENSVSNSVSLYIPGTNFKKTIDTTGPTFIQVISEEITLIYYNNETDSSILDTTFTPIKNDTLNFFNTKDSLFQPSTPTGLDTIPVDSIESFSTIKQNSKLTKKLEYQFDWGDGASSDWNTSVTAEKSWSLPGKYEIKVIARIINDTSISSVSSEPSFIIVIDPENPDTTITPEIHFVSAPSKPYGPTTVTLDSITSSYHAIYSTDSSKCSYTHPVEYKFFWDIDSGGTNETNWSPSNQHEITWYFPGTYSINIVARCSDSTDIISNASELLNVTVQ